MHSSLSIIFISIVALFVIVATDDNNSNNNNRNDENKQDNNNNSCPRNCYNRGKCTAGVCRCQSAYTGAYCQRRAVTTTTSGGGGGTACNPACVQGRCSFGVCRCSSGYKGVSCDLPICNDGCNEASNNGYCYRPNFCKCYRGYTGRDCSIPPTSAACKPGCINGYCDNAVCKCQSGFSGDSCEKAVRPTTSDNNNQAGSVGVSCKSQSDCFSIDNSYCETYSGSCRVWGGTCACNSGYEAAGGRCVMLGNVGDSCASNSVICTRNTQCSTVSQTCQCVVGYTRGPAAGNCTLSTASAQLGQACQSNGDCYYDLICSSGRCACSVGRTPDGTFACRRITYNDQCASDQDCAHLTGSRCYGGTCSCKDGYKFVSYTTERGETRQTCANSVLSANNFCQTLGSRDSVCKLNYACIQCPNTFGSPQCLWQGALPPAPAPSPASSPASSPDIYSKSPGLLQGCCYYRLMAVVALILHIKLM